MWGTPRNGEAFLKGLTAVSNTDFLSQYQKRKSGSSDLRCALSEQLGRCMYHLSKIEEGVNHPKLSLEGF